MPIRHELSRTKSRSTSASARGPLNLLENDYGIDALLGNPHLYFLTQTIIGKKGGYENRSRDRRRSPRLALQRVL